MALELKHSLIRTLRKKKPNKPDAPVANFTETKMVGKLTDLISVEKPGFYTPGTYGSEGTGTPTLKNALAYPIYNNAVGTFALLNSPKIKAYKSPRVTFNKYYEGYELPPSPSNSPPVEKYRGYQSWGGNYQFQLGNDLYYALNDINIKSHSIKVSIEVEGNPINTSSINSNLYLDPTKVTNFTSQQIETDEFYPIKVNNGLGYNSGGNYCTNFFDNTICTYEQYDLENTNYNKDLVIFSSPYFSIDEISPIVLSFGFINDIPYYAANSPNFIEPENDGYRFENIQTKLKLIVDVVYNDLDENGDNITEILMFTYNVNDLEWVNTPLETDLQNSPTNYSAYEENLILNTTVFDGSQVEGCKLVGTHYTCHGWDDVTIVGDLTTLGGHTVDIFGANSVFVIGESNVSPEIVLDINFLLDNSYPMPRADALFVEGYCKNTLGEGFPEYLANTPNKQALEEFEAVNNGNISESTSFEPLSVNLYPVPTNQLLNIHSSVELTNEIITLLDLSGRVLNLPIRKINDQDFEINVAKLAEGSYYLTISSNEGQAKKLFMVVKNN